MTLALPILADGHLLTHSSEATFRACPRKYFYAYRMGIRPAHQHDALRLGTAFHAGLEAIKQGLAEDDAARAVRTLYADVVCPPWMDADAFAVEEETAVTMVRGYACRYAEDRIVNFLAVELAFDLPLVNPHTGQEHPFYRNAGKIDGIAELPDGRIAIIEHKTVSGDISPGSEYFKKLLLDAQISRYWMAAHQLGYDVQTVVYDCTRKPEIRPKKVAKADRALATSRGDYFGLPLNQMCPEQETPQMFAARLLADMISRSEFYFQRCEVPRLQSDLEEFAMDQWSLVKQISQCELDGHWPRNTNACLTLSPCVYLDVCKGFRGNPNEQIPEGFRQIETLHPELIPAEQPERSET